MPLSSKKRLHVSNSKIGIDVAAFLIGTSFLGGWIMKLLSSALFAAVLTSGCVTGDGAAPDREAADGFQSYETPSAKLNPNTPIPLDETYCDAEYLRLHPTADCDDFGRDPDQKMGGR
jgi:hypothetical protein